MSLLPFLPILVPFCLSRSPLLPFPLSLPQCSPFPGSLPFLGAPNHAVPVLVPHPPLSAVLALSSARLPWLQPRWPRARPLQ